ncbi:MAG: hypothetical protein RDV48_29790, partial [Candidatus Eremiobacteraeota bacterium]|nr:hypothetical protein [Candidatus Eremiobacteraeota bacterium]
GGGMMGPGGQGGGMMGPGGQGGGMMGPGGQGGGMMGPGGQGGGMMGPGGQGGQGGGMMGPGGQGGQGGGMMGPGGQGGGMMGPGGQGGQGGGMMRQPPLGLIDLVRGVTALSTHEKYKLSKVQKQKIAAILEKALATYQQIDNNNKVIQQAFTKNQVDYIKSQRYSEQGIEMGPITPDEMKNNVDPAVMAAVKFLREKSSSGSGGAPGAQGGTSPETNPGQ